MPSSRPGTWRRPPPARTRRPPAALDVAAALAVSKGAPLAAAAAWERAAELSEAAEAGAARLAEAAEAALTGGDLNRVRRLTQTAPAAGLSPFRARMLAVRGRLDLLTGQMAAAQRELQESADQAADLDPRLAVELLDQAVSAAVDAGLYDRASWVAEQMASLAGRSDETPRFLADLACGRLAWWRGDPEHGMQLISQAVSRLEADPTCSRQPRAPVRYLRCLVCCRGFRSRSSLQRPGYRPGPRRRRARPPPPTALSQAAFLDKEMGRWTRTLAHASQALDLARATGQPLLACEMLVYMAEVEAAQGRGRSCSQHTLEADQVADELGVRWPQLLARRSQALLEFSLGRLEEAITHYDQLRRLAARWGIIHPYYSPIPDLIEAHAQALLIERGSYSPNTSPRCPATRTRRPPPAPPDAGESSPQATSTITSRTRSPCTSAVTSYSSTHGRAWLTGSGCAAPSGAATPASSSALPSRSSTGSMPARGPSGPEPSSAPAAKA